MHERFKAYADILSWNVTLLVSSFLSVSLSPDRAGPYDDILRDAQLVTAYGINIMIPALEGIPPIFVRARVIFLGGFAFSCSLIGLACGVLIRLR